MTRLSAAASCVLLSGCWVSTGEIGNKFLGTPGDDTEPTTTIPTGKDAADADTDTDTDADTDADTDTDPTTTPTDPWACADDDLAKAKGDAVVSADTTGMGNDLDPFCYGSPEGGAADLMYTWKAPSAGCWEFSLEGAKWDTTLAILDQCAGVELACNDDEDLLYNVSWSRVGADLADGQEVLVVVDGFDKAAKGTFDLGIHAGDLLPVQIDVGTATGQNVATGNSNGEDTTIDPDVCLFKTGRDVFVQWTAPESATWRFATGGTNFDAAVSVHRQCTTSGIACGDGFGLGGDRVDAWFNKDEAVIVRIAGYDSGDGGASGNWELDITKQ